MKYLSSVNTEAAPSDWDEFPSGNFELTAIDYFEPISEKFKEKIAIIDRTSSIKYGELNNRSNQLARAILDSLGDVRDEPILFLSNQSISSIIITFAILKSGNIFIALDISNPIERLNAIFEDSGSRLLITTNQDLELAGKLITPGMKLINLDALEPGYSGENLPIRSKPADLAVIYYTSGSTGKPKGVLLDHRALMERVAAMINPEFITRNDRILMPFPLVFGWSVQPIFAALLTGATLFMISYTDRSLSELRTWMEKEKISYMPAPATFFRQFLASLPEGSRELFPNMRNIHVGGEVFHPQDVRKWQAHFSKNCRLVQTLASTEAGIITKMFYHTNTPIDRDVLTVGYLFDIMKLVILDEDNNPVGENVIGQIAYSSPSLLKGYWKRPELNDRLFIPDPDAPGKTLFLSGDMGCIRFDGELEFHGRKDDLLKIRGFRVEVAEVEASLAKHPAVKNVCVMGLTEQNISKAVQLIAYINLFDGSQLSQSEIRSFCIKNLPDYMVPSRFIFIHEWPLNQNGKVDRKALPKPDSSRPDLASVYSAPKTELENQICDIWQEVLGLGKVGLDDDFFELGGSSLSALQMIMAVEKIIPKKISTEFFLNPTIASLVSNLDLIDENISQVNDKEERAKLPGQLGPRSSLRRRLGFIRKAIPFWPYYFILRQPYGTGLNNLLKFSRKSRLLKLIYGRQFELMKQFISNFPDHKPLEEIMQANFIGNILSHLFTRSYRFDLFDPLVDKQDKKKNYFWFDMMRIFKVPTSDEFQKYFTVEGRENLERAMKTGKGIILVTYHGIARFAILAMRFALNTNEILVVTQKRARDRGTVWATDKARKGTRAFDSAVLADEALKGQRLLTNGRIIQIVSDVDNEIGGTFQANLTGHKYKMKIGLAELALNTESIVIPFYTTVRGDGKFVVVIKPPLEPGSGERQEQINSMMNGYVSFLNHAWMNDPESMNWKKIKEHLKIPTVDGS